MKRAERRKFHYIYKITRLDESGKYYIGMHSTDDINDGYFGSGSVLSKSIKKHGKEKHSKEILEYLESREALKLREKELVDHTTLKDPLCLNLQLGGGEGGFINTEHQLKCSSAGGKVGGKTAGKLNGAANLAKARATGKYCGKIWTGQKHTPKTRDQMLLSQQNVDRTGSKNPMFGKKLAWVSKQGEVKRIPLEGLDQHLGEGWIRGIKR